MKREFKRTWSRIQTRLGKWNRPKTYVGLTGFTLLVSLVFHIRYSAFPFDDALIHMRIARNIVDHGQPYFNIGEPVMGSSPHLWINGVALLFLCFGPNPLWVSIYSYVLFLAGVLVFMRLFEKEGLKKERAAFAASALLTIYSLFAASGLMETALVTLLLGGALLALKIRDGFWAGFFSGLVIWGRYEFIFVPVLGFLLSRKKRNFALGAMIPGGLFLAYCLFYFKTFVPQPVRAKPLVYFGAGKFNFREISKPLLWIVRGGNELLRRFGTLFIEGAVLYVAFAWSKRSSTRLLLALGAIISLAYTIQRTYLFPWYLPNVYLPLGLGFTLLLIDLSQWKTKKEQRKFWGAVFLAYSFLVTPTEFFIKTATGALVGNLNRYPEFAANLRVQGYFNVGKKLSAISTDKVLLTSELGGLGWSYNGPMKDGMALVSPESLKFHPMEVPRQRANAGIGAIPLDYIKEQKPDWVVSLPIFIEEAAPYLNDPSGPYELFLNAPVFGNPTLPANTELPPKLWGSPEIRVYRRKS